MKDWCHQECGDATYIDQRANLTCFRNCKPPCPIVNCRFACGKHVNQFQKPDALGLCQAISMMRAAANDVTDRKWYAVLFKSVAKLVEDQADRDLAEDDQRNIREDF